MEKRGVRLGEAFVCYLDSEAEKVLLRFGATRVFKEGGDGRRKVVEVTMPLGTEIIEGTTRGGVQSFLFYVPACGGYFTLRKGIPERPIRTLEVTIPAIFCEWFVELLPPPFGA